MPLSNDNVAPFVASIHFWATVQKQLSLGP